MTKYLHDVADFSVSIRSINLEDAAFLLELNNDLEISKYVVGTPKKVTMDEQLLWMENAKSDTRTKRFIVECDKMPVGTVIISNIDMLNLTGSIGIKLHGSARGKGIGKKSINLALKYCFETMKLCCVTAHVLPYNNASLALFKSCGFVKEGILRSRVIKNGERCDLISFSMTYNDFRY